MAAEKPRDPTKKFTFSVRTRTLFWRRADEKGETPAPPRRVTLGQLPFLPHSDETLQGLSRLDRACLAFLRFVVARRVVACCSAPPRFTRTCTPRPGSWAACACS